jgi:hypothetical protein
MRLLSFSARRALLYGLAALLSACTDPYLPDVIKAPPSYLVVDGFINTQGVTTIKLSRTIAVASAAAPPAEAKATVTIDEEAGPRFPLRESPNGTYASAVLTLNPAKRYRLHINTAAGKEYASDFVVAKTTPPLDKLEWRAEASGLNVYLSTHDATNRTQYYRWQYEETWEIHPTLAPIVEYKNSAIRPLAVLYPKVCWPSARSTAIQLQKTTALTRDEVLDYRLQQLPTNSDRLYSLYSLLVQQHALTKEEYEYWELLRKNTESIGSLFDPQPSQLTGNVHCLTDANEAALGYVGAHSVVEQRIFVRRAELPVRWPIQTGYEGCLPADSVSLYPPGMKPPSPEDILRDAFSVPTYLPIEPYTDLRGRVIGYTAKSLGCVDCRTRGTAVKPSYWP